MVRNLSARYSTNGLTAGSCSYDSSSLHFAASAKDLIGAMIEYFATARQRDHGLLAYTKCKSADDVPIRPIATVILAGVTAAAIAIPCTTASIAEL